MLLKKLVIAQMKGSFWGFMFTLLLLSGPSVFAEVSTTGDVQPADPTTWTTSTTAYIGKTADGTMDITAGSTVTDYWALVGGDPGVIGEVTVDGTGSTWTNSFSLFVGSFGNGTLNIKNSGTVSVAGLSIGMNGTVNLDGGVLELTNNMNFYGWTGAFNFTGGEIKVSNGNIAAHAVKTLNSNQTLTVTGSNSRWEGNIQANGGYINIINGGKVNSTIAAIGISSGSTSVVTVDGAGSTWANSSNMCIADSGSGTLNITNGGTVNNTYGNIGEASGSTGLVTVDGIGSAWTNGSSLYVGNSGSGTLNITNGGTVSNTYGNIGEASGSTGLVTVDGIGSAWTNSSSLYVGNSGSGTLNITNGGTVSNTSGLISGLMGLVIVDGINSKWANSSNLSIGGYNGVLNITNGGKVSSACGNIGNFSGSIGKVIVDGPGSTWTNNNELYIGGSEFSFGEGNGTLNIINGGIVNNSYGSIAKSSGSIGMVTVDGTGSTWTNSSTLYVGRSGNGVLNIKNGGAVNSNTGYVGYDLNSTGEATVDGTGSTWTNNSILSVSGYKGNGTLNIFNSGIVSSQCGYIGEFSGSTGTVTVDGVGSTWINSDYLYVGNYGNGMLNVNNEGLVTNTSGYIGYDASSIGTVIVNGVGSTWANSSYLYVGYSGNGTLNIANGGDVSSEFGFIGNSSDSIGLVTVNGTGSTWTNNSNLYVGYGYQGNGTLNIINGGTINNISGYGVIGYSSGSIGVVNVDGIGSKWLNNSMLKLGLGGGNGTLNITNGSLVSNTDGVIGYNSGSTCAVTVDGAGSKWNNSTVLYIGCYGNGTLNISNGGLVTVGENAYIYPSSLLSIGVSNDDMLTIGGNFANDGTVRLSAGAGLLAGQYSPISVMGSWLGSGHYDAFGGVWDSMAHTFTVTAAQKTQAGQQMTIDLQTTQRIDVGDTLEVNFSPTQSSNQLNFTASVTGDAVLDALIALLGESESVQGSWDFNISGLPFGNSVLLSFAVTGSDSADDLNVWHYSAGTGWTQYDANDLVLSNGWASFTVSRFSSYAITSVPEPATLSLLLVGGLALFRRLKPSELRKCL